VSTPDLRLVLPAVPENVIVVRQALAGMGEALGMESQRVDDLKAVVTEACNNVVIHAYEDGPGPLEVTATSGDDEVEVVIQDQGTGFTPRADQSGEPSLGIGLPLIASLSDSFEIRGGAGVGTRTIVRFAYRPSGAATDGDAPADDQDMDPALALAFAPGDVGRGILARVIGALAARADFPVDRLADTILIGDALSGHTEEDFLEGRVGISITDGDGTLDLRVGPLSEGGGERLLAQMEIPGGGSLSSLTRSMKVEQGETAQGAPAEFLHFEVAP
jgi:anti-sigma regulatory factor (Ser/Thr protein kinase)